MMNVKPDTCWLKITISKGNFEQERLIARLTQWDMLGLQETDQNLEVYFASDWKSVIPKIIAELKTEWPTLKTVVSEVRDDGWSVKWQEYFKPQIISPRLAVRPYWEKSVNGAAVEIVLKPGMAFGTGAHATTRLALLMLEKYLKPPATVLDAGCGSGILTIAALKLGAGQVTAWDIDPDVADNFLDNLALNELSGKAHLNIGDATNLPDYNFDLIMSNIERQPNLKLLRALTQHQSRSIVIFTGLLKEECELFNDAVLNYGREIIEKRFDDEWLALVAK
ncbi:MAG: 50S ribosomal protein L11 methyltransferase [Candidatus Neomarinimicrobiota bacterium]